jgi:hypothetical protein
VSQFHTAPRVTPSSLAKDDCEPASLIARSLVITVYFSLLLPHAPINFDHQKQKADKNYFLASWFICPFCYTIQSCPEHLGVFLESKHHD